MVTPMISESAQVRLSNDAIPLRQQILGILAAAFLAGVLFFRFSLPPQSWRRMDASMSMEELHAKLGEPSAMKANEIGWRERRLLGNWELTVHLNEESGKSLQNNFRFGKESK